MRTVPYFPVTPTLRVRFVCGSRQRSCINRHRRARRTMVVVGVGRGGRRRGAGLGNAGPLVSLVHVTFCVA
jgi:hypothetical protein